jgi:hypothetical protein
MPRRLLLPKIDALYKVVCLHCHFGELWQQQVLLGIQTTVAVLFTLGFQTRIMAILSWYLYTSLILRNTWLYFILDRYIYYLLFATMFLPLDERWSIAQKYRGSEGTRKQPLVVSPATVSRWLLTVVPFVCISNWPSNLPHHPSPTHKIGMKILVFWIYLDAGGGKYMDPLQGWSYYADPLPALDTYTRHTGEKDMAFVKSCGNHVDRLDAASPHLHKFFLLCFQYCCLRSGRAVHICDFGSAGASGDDSVGCLH